MAVTYLNIHKKKKQARTELGQAQLKLRLEYGSV